MSLSVPPLLKETLQIMGSKRTMLHACRESISTVAVGSSHGDFGFNPEFFPEAFNLCGRSQDLKHSFYLYQKAAQICPKLDSVIVFYSIFSAGSCLELSPSEKYICSAVNELFELQIRYEDQELNDLSVVTRDLLKGFVSNMKGFNGFLANPPIGFSPDSYGAERKAKEHMRYNKGSEGLLYLARIFLLAKHLNHKIFIVIPPARSDYVKEVKKINSEPFEGIKDFVNSSYISEQVKIIDIFDNKIFKDEYFGDFDHLIPSGNGARILSTLLGQVVND